MNETTKTSIIVGIALLLLAAVWFLRMTGQEEDAPDMRGKQLFAEFDDPTKAASLEIIEYNESTASIRPFKVAKVDGTWSIPSHDDYPADAKDQVAKAAVDLIDLKVLDIASENSGDHGLYEVVDPDPNSLDSGTTGVGTRIVMRNPDNKELVSIVVGTEVPDQPELRYVRKVGQDTVYVVKFDTSNLSTKFGDWIEKDLLKLNSINIKQININDYTFDELNNQQIHRGRLQLAYDDSADPMWTMTEKQFSETGEPTFLELNENEELDTQKINELKNALNDLKIVDVRRKPEGLSGDLKDSGAITIDAESRLSLRNKGFHLFQMGDGFVLISNNGDIGVALKDGVQYVFQFGRIAATADGEKKDKDKDDNASVNRYLFVRVEFNPDMIEKPQFDPLPESVKTSDDKETEAADQEKVEDDKETEAAEKEKVEDDKETEAAEKEKVEDDKETEAAEKEKVEDDKEIDQTDQEKAIEAERKRIEKENTRKQEAYDDKIAEGKEAVAKLNERFADWYYIISDEVYQKIHLGRDDLVKLKEDDKKDESGKVNPFGDIPDFTQPHEETFTPDDFQRLKQTPPGKHHAAFPMTPQHSETETE